MGYPADLKYSKDHEWVRVEDGIAFIGITDFAQKELGDIVYIEHPQVGRKLEQNDSFGTIESVKTVSELYSPVTGEVVAINEEAATEPELVNTDPYGTWLIKVKASNLGDLDNLLSAAEYEALVRSGD